MEEVVFSIADILQMEALGITESKVREQIKIFQRSSCFVHLDRYCTPEDGVQTISHEDTHRYLALHATAAEQKRFRKFVPSSGAATRMFQALLQIYHLPHFLNDEELNQRAECGVSIVCDFLAFLEGLHRFAFVDDLKAVLRRDRHTLEGLIEQRQYRTILEYVLSDRGLSLSALPKALLKFHRYPEECRTAFAEHLVEAAHYLCNGSGPCDLHFTISPEFLSQFHRLLNDIAQDLEQRFGVSYEVGFSFQKSSTDTIAVDMDNHPFRDHSGRLVFRPGGHGALIENLNDLKGDLVYIKNVDNLVPDRLKHTTVFWKKVLGGYLIEIQSIVHDHIRELNAGISESTIKRAEHFARHRLLIQFPRAYEASSLEEKQSFLLDELNRPIRVCGVVMNVGEPGGAPFWVKDKKGAQSLQIVEKAQVDFSDPEQRDIWKSSTHFNPVDLVCAVRDYEGNPFDLRKFVDPHAVFITKKSKEGRDLKALELPGLWNGAMSDWITVVVDVPRITFNPVKTIFDLLKPEHQPENPDDPPPTGGLGD